MKAGDFFLSQSNLNSGICWEIIHLEATGRAGAGSGANEDMQKVVSQRNKRLHFGRFGVVLLWNMLANTLKCLRVFGWSESGASCHFQKRHVNI